MFILGNLPAEQAQDFLSRSGVPQNFHMYYSAKEISRQCTEDFTADITERASSEFGAGYRNHISPLLQDQFNYMPTQDTRDWANRFFSITDSHATYQALTGIRYRGQDLNRPFIDVIATNIPCTTVYIAALSQSLLRHYESFRPICTRFFVPGKVDQLIHDVGSVPGSRATTIDMHIVAGTLGELDKRPWPKNYDRVELIPLSPADASAASHEAQRIYESIAVKNSNFFEWATPQGEESFENAIRQGTGWHITVDNSSAGFLTLDRRGEQGLRGFSVEELCLDAPFRRQGLGNAVLRHGIKNLLKLPQVNPQDMLWGTIHADNVPSLRNAQGIGRAIIGSYIWVGDQSFEVENSRPIRSSS